MKRLLATSILLALFLYSLAIPSTREPFTVRQSDGTSLTLVQIGDEVFHYLTTLDGMPVVEDGDSYFYASVSDGKLTASCHLAHDEGYRSTSEKSIVSSLKTKADNAIHDTWSRKLKRRNEARMRGKGDICPTNESRQRKTFGRPSSFTGKNRGLVILAQFADLKFNPNSSREKYDKVFNQKNYKEGNLVGSVHDYFYDQSYGKFDIEFDVIGPITLSHPHSYYGENDENGNDKRVCEMVQEACTMVSEYCDFLDYDWNGDNEVEQVYIVYAGPGEHTMAGANYIWPHEWTLDDGLEETGDGTGNMTIGGALINTYAMSCELASGSSSDMDGIGTACHEFSHCLGLPDTYCTNNESYAFAMSYWDLLSRGSANGLQRHGEVPCGYTAYERWFAGWLEPIELHSPCNITNMPCIGDAPIAYIIYNDADRNEFFMLENRQPSNRWFSYASSYTGCSGLLVYHIDYDDLAWEQNEINYTYEHQRMSVVPADNSYGRFTFSSRTYSASEADLKGDLFPGLYGVTQLTDESHKDFGGQLFNPNTDGTFSIHKPITNIAESDGLISFCFMGGGETFDCTGIGTATNDSHTEYFNLSGIRTNTAPSSKGLYIMRQDGVTKKIIR